MIEIPALMRKLAIKRPLFHSEADFQHALAWRIHEEHPDSSVRLEYKPPINADTDKMQLDIWLAKLGVAIELKYKTGKPKHEIRHNGESFDLRHHRAHDHGRYDFLKDIWRLERLSAFPDAKAGFAIFLTNDDLYWRGPISKDTIDAQFSLGGNPDLKIQGTMAWKGAPSEGTTSNREDPIELNWPYQVQWQHYSRVATERERYGEFRYLMVQVRLDASPASLPNAPCRD